MKKPVRRVAMAMIVLFTLVILNLNYLQVIRADSLSTAPGNNRVLLNEYGRQRGSIIVGGTPIAVSQATNDKLKYLRTYPKGPEYAAVTGYYSIVFGTSGIERAENDILAGSDDRMLGSSLADLFSGRDRKGGNVLLTIDPTAQDAAYQALTEAKVTGAVVALDPSTGAILAMVSTPAYDPNPLSTHSPSDIRANAAALAAQAPDPRINQATSETYPPGSIFKVVDSAAAMVKGLTPETVIPAVQEYTLPGTQTTLKNFGGESCSANEKITLLQALTISCNTAFAQLAVDQLGESAVRDMSASFGINDEGFDTPLPVAGSSVGEIIDQAALAQSAIGQRDVRVTPTQAAMLAATVANDGQLMKPYLVAETQRPDLSVLDKAEPEAMGDPAFDDKVAKQLTTMMVSVVDNGTGKKAQVAGVKVAGKTGTAEVADGVSPHAWFSGFAPADNPKIAIAVFIKNGGNAAGETTTGGDISAPIAQQVLQAYLNEKGTD